MALSFDWDDPVARLTALREVYFNIISGQQEQRILFRNGDNHQQEMVFHDANVSKLEGLIAQAEIDAGKRKRFAITAGARR